MLSLFLEAAQPREPIAPEGDPALQLFGAGVGGGTRVRHTLAIGVDLGLPTGGIAQLVGAMEECNAVFLNALLAKHGLAGEFRPAAADRSSQTRASS